MSRLRRFSQRTEEGRAPGRFSGLERTYFVEINSKEIQESGLSLDFV
jgi:hypothetical protein